MCSLATYHSGHLSCVFWDIYHRLVYSVGSARCSGKVSWTVLQLFIWITHGGSSSAYPNTFPGSCTLSSPPTPGHWPFPDLPWRYLNNYNREKLTHGLMLPSQSGSQSPPGRKPHKDQEVLLTPLCQNLIRTSLKGVSSSWANKKYFTDKNPTRGNVSCLQKAE